MLLPGRVSEYEAARLGGLTSTSTISSSSRSPLSRYRSTARSSEYAVRRNSASGPRSAQYAPGQPGHREPLDERERLLRQWVPRQVASNRVASPDRDRTGDEGEQRVKALSETELVRVIDRMPEEWRLFFRFLAQMGLRIGEAVELRWLGVDLGQATARVGRSYSRGRVEAPKNRYGERTLRLSPDMARALWALRKETRAADDGLVFVVSRGARVDPSNLLSRVVKPAAVEAGLGEWVVRKGKPRLPEAPHRPSRRKWRHRAVSSLPLLGRLAPTARS